MSALMPKTGLTLWCYLTWKYDLHHTIQYLKKYKRKGLYFSWNLRAEWVFFMNSSQTMVKLWVCCNLFCPKHCTFTSIVDICYYVHDVLHIILLSFIFCALFFCSLCTVIIQHFIIKEGFFGIVFLFSFFYCIPLNSRLNICSVSFLL